MESIGSPETLVSSRLTPRNNPEDWIQVIFKSVWQNLCEICYTSDLVMHMCAVLKLRTDTHVKYSLLLSEFNQKYN
jgi:hypothetical protein